MTWAVPRSGSHGPDDCHLASSPVEEDAPVQLWPQRGRWSRTGCRVSRKARARLPLTARRLARLDRSPRSKAASADSTPIMPASSRRSSTSRVLAASAFMAKTFSGMRPSPAAPGDRTPGGVRGHPCRRCRRSPARSASTQAARDRQRPSWPPSRRCHAARTRHQRPRGHPGGVIGQRHGRTACREDVRDRSLRASRSPRAVKARSRPARPSRTSPASLMPLPDPGPTGRPRACGKPPVPIPAPRPAGSPVPPGTMAAAAPAGSPTKAEPHARVENACR